MGQTLENTQAMDRFLASVERRAFRMAQIASGNKEDALDIVQDAMLALVQRYGRRPQEEWKSLFFRILQNRIRDWYRRNKVRSRWRVWLGRGRQEEEPEDPLAALADPEARNPSQQAIASDAVAAIDVALRTLPVRQQQAFLLRAWEGMSVGETAAVMRCSEGSVKTHYSRAVHRLRDMLEEYWK